MRKHYSPTLKAKVVLELLKEEKPLTQIAFEQRIHPTQLRDWKKQALEGLPNLFADSSEAVRATAQLEHQQDELYAEIGRLTTQVGWLKKKSGLEPPAS
jgi:putative transposase